MSFSPARLRSLLFVPATRLDRIGKAVATGTDIVCVDLEDSVPPDQKTQCRQALIETLTGPDAPSVAVRINGLRTKDGLHDLVALGDLPTPPSLVFLPMAESRAEIDIAAAAALPETSGIVPLIESPAGLDQAASIAAHPRVAAMMFGGGDMAAALGVALEWEPLLHARSRFVMAVAPAGKIAIDVPWIRLGDADGLADETQRSKRLGFAAKAAIHPDQIDTIHRVMSPTAEEIEEARAAIEAFEAGGGHAVRFRGRMLEAPVMAKFHQILTQGE
jgi:(S)-citramalyl-CoA lyase